MENKFEDKLYMAKKMCEGKIIIDRFVDIYPFTTENISGYINEFDLNNKSLLTVGSSLDQVINAAIFNCHDINVIDICPFTKFYFYLKKAAILSLTYKEFLYFFCYKDFPKTFNNNINAFKKEIFLKFKSTLEVLDSESYFFWNELFSCYDAINIRKNLFNMDEYKISILKKCNTYLNDEYNFNISKDKIKDIEPLFIIDDIFNLKLDRKFDNIWLSNIGSYLQIENLKKVVDNLFNNLTEEGKILICYLYETIKTTKYRKEWADIYNLDEVYKVFSNYSLDLKSFIGIHGLVHDFTDLKDSVLVYKRTID